MSKSKTTPDAWDDDDWEAQADRAEKEPSHPQSAPEQPMTKAERIAKHKEEQRMIWESAEAPKEVNFLVATTTPPLATPFKPAVKLLSRKPAPKSVMKKDPVTGIEKLVLVDDEEEEAPKYQPTPDEIRQRQQRELEEKQRRYNEARAKIFGESSPSAAGQAASGTVTPPSGGGEGRHNYRGRGRGGRGGGGDHRSNNTNARQEDQTRRAPQPPTQQPAGTRELYDPNYTPKPAFNVQRRGGDASPQSGSRSGTPRAEEQVIRQPRGPDASGRGGFGFARGGARGI
ncbi:hypothetical protein QBC39DRAFT_403553 [Podospora conica]|nr:hypothetical protein QBC39DRAFT_403553 [Schizothecium conicum]